MKEYPILFSTPMVQAVEDGRKTMTRRVVNLTKLGCLDPADERDTANILEASPYGQVGDRLWVREAFYCNDYRYPDAPHTELLEEITYRADHESPCRCEEPLDGHWKPSIHMPRWASRINLEITGVRVERLNQITEEDAKAEGVLRPEDLVHDDENSAPYIYRIEFHRLWNDLNAKRGFGWDVNPWVWVIEFRTSENNKCSN